MVNMNVDRDEQIRQAVADGLARGLRMREAALAAGCSEGEALAAHMPARWPGGQPPSDAALVAYPVRPDWLALLRALQACGPLLALTRNDVAVHEKIGIYQNLSSEGSVGLVLGEVIDLRLFWRHWHVGFAVADRPGQRPRSLQFFDHCGQAIHKIYWREGADRHVWEQVCHRFLSQETSVLFQGECGESSDAAQVDHVDVAALLQAWGAMTDTHEFFDLLKRFGVSRKQAMQLARGRYTRQVGNNSVQLLLEAASFEQVPIMVFVGNPGCIQIHTGPVRQIHVAQYQGNTWVNVLDADFNFHLLQDKVRECWVVEKPTRDGVVTSLEVFDDKGRAVAMLFGARKPGQPELASWRALLQDLPTLAQQEAAA